MCCCRPQRCSSRGLGALLAGGAVSPKQGSYSGDWRPPQGNRGYGVIGGWGGPMAQRMAPAWVPPPLIGGFGNSIPGPTGDRQRAGAATRSSWDESGAPTVGARWCARALRRRGLCTNHVVIAAAAQLLFNRA